MTGQRAGNKVTQNRPLWACTPVDIHTPRLRRSAHAGSQPTVAMACWRHQTLRDLWLPLFIHMSSLVKTRCMGSELYPFQKDVSEKCFLRKQQLVISPECTFLSEPSWGYHNGSYISCQTWTLGRRESASYILGCTWSILYTPEPPEPASVKMIKDWSVWNKSC